MPLPLVTVTSAVCALAMSDAGTDACSSSLVLNVVASGAPFQFTTASEAKPVPYTVSVNADEPGPFGPGANGAFRKGTGASAATAHSDIAMIVAMVNSRPWAKWREKV